jgi:hypothetical protein
MLKRFLLITGLLFTVYSSQAQFDTSFMKINIRRCADSLSHGFKIKNWELFTLYNYPGLIGTMGGKNEFMKYMGLMFSQIDDSCWKQYEPGKILQIIKTGGDYQTVIELKSILEWQGMRISSTSHLIGESWDGGLFWTFFNSEGDRQSALLIKPDLSEQLMIPQIKEIKEQVSAPVKQKQSQ